MNNAGVFEDRKSPISTSAPSNDSVSGSGSASPHVIRPPLLNTRPRSSSINSNGSNQSNNTRSLSIASLESPRNSIVSIDDGFLKSSTRNNSTASLSSLAGGAGGNGSGGGTTTPKHNSGANANAPHLIKDRFLFNLSKLKSGSINSSVLLSDDDSESDYQRLIKPKFKSRSGSNNSGVSTSNSSLTGDLAGSNSPSSHAIASLNANLVPNHLNSQHHGHANVHNNYSNLNVTTPPSNVLNLHRMSKKSDRLMLKKDYRFKFNDILKKSSPESRHINNCSQSHQNNCSQSHQNNSSQSEDSSKLHNTPDVPAHNVTTAPTNKSQNQASSITDTPSPLALNVHENLPKTTIEQNRENFKRKSSLKQPVHSLKKNLLYSKDIRLELLANRDFEGFYNSKFLTPKKDIAKDLSLQTTSNNTPTASSSLTLSPQISPTSSANCDAITSRRGSDYKVPSSPPPSGTPLKSKSRSNKLDEGSNTNMKAEFPLLSTLKQQNQLISKLNQKWNKLDKTFIEKSTQSESDKRSKRRYSSTDDETDY